MTDISNAASLYHTRKQQMEENGCKHWFHDDGEGECPFCHTVFQKLFDETGNVFPVWKYFAYCPQCGEPVALDWDDAGVRSWEDEEVANGGNQGK